ncbi:MAG: PAS-domain containing protein, partial [Fimbriimonadaceae bacterium]|nr:PAS-domain containing protein [Alphaproteobacteria bacterium]
MPAARSVKGFQNQKLVKGLASLNIRNSYLRRLQIETVLRYSIPVLIIIFVSVVGVAIALHLVDERTGTISNAKQNLKLTADLLTERLDTPQLVKDSSPTEAQRTIFDQTIKNSVADRSIAIILSDDKNNVLITRADPAVWKNLSFDVFLASDRQLVELAARADIIKTVLAGDTEVFAAIRSFGPNNAFHLFVVQSRASAEASWNRTAAFFITLFSSAGFVIFLLCGAFYWQAARADESDGIYEETRVRLNAAIESGGAGLWDWDIAGGRIFWSGSMFDILGLASDQHILSLDEINQRVNSQDIDLYSLANELMQAGTQTSEIDQTFRIRNIEGDWVWLRLRGKLLNGKGKSKAHLVGIAMDISEQRELSEKLDLSALSLAEAVATTSEAFVLWDRDNNLVLCNPTYLEFHNLPDHINNEATSYDDVIRQAGNSIVRTIAATPNGHQRGNRSYEAQLEDGRWLKVNERRTSDGGYVSLGTDITALKKHEERLMESERELMATIVDLQHSRQTLEEQAQQLID